MLDEAKGFDDIKFSRFLLVSIVSLFNFLNILFLYVVLYFLGYDKLVSAIYSYSLYLWGGIWLFWILVVYQRYILQERYKKISVEKNIEMDKRPFLYYLAFTILTLFIFLLLAVL